jgi:hypothetical protein
MSRTGDELLTDLRIDIDEYTEANWDNASLYSFLNRAANKVAGVLRLTGQGYLEKIISQSDSAVTIYGVTYTPSTSLALTAGDTELELPEDCVEVREILATSQTLLDRGVQFIPRKSNSTDFSNARRIESSTNRISYFYAPIGRNSILIAPPIGETINIKVHYAAMPARVESGVELESIPEYAVDSLLTYAKYLALSKIQHEDRESQYQIWLKEKRDIIEMSQYRQDDLITEGVFEDEDWYADYDSLY